MLAVVVLITDAGALRSKMRGGAVIAGVICNPNMIIWGVNCRKPNIRVLDMEHRNGTPGPGAVGPR